MYYRHVNHASFNSWGRASFETSLLLLLATLLAPSSVSACGWWGDGEISRDMNNAVVNAPDGSAIEQTLSVRSSKLPGDMGYGIAVPEPGRAVPYLLATNGRAINRIAEFKIFGFISVIDLGTHAEEAAIHRRETEDAGMDYFTIPLEGNMPSPGQAATFTRMVIKASSQGPLLVYASTAQLLGAMWALYRINLGAPLDYALMEGIDLGMTSQQEEELRQRKQ